MSYQLIKLLLDIDKIGRDVTDRGSLITSHSKLRGRDPNKMRKRVHQSSPHSPAAARYFGFSTIARLVSKVAVFRSLARSLWHSLKQVALRLVKVRHRYRLALLLGSLPFPLCRPAAPHLPPVITLPLVTTPTSPLPAPLLLAVAAATTATTTTTFVSILAGPWSISLSFLLS